MVSVLFGVAVAAGGHLLWQRTHDDVTLTLSAEGGGADLDGQSGGGGRPESSFATGTETSPATEESTGHEPAESTSSSPTPSTRPADEPPPTTSSTTVDTPAETETRPDPEIPPSTSSGASPSGTVVQLVNDERAEAGCEAVRVDSRLATSAQKHSDDMAERDYLSHTSPEGTTFSERIESAGYPKPGAENIAMGMASAEAVMDAWMSSDGHRRNILNCEFTAIGVAVNSSGWYWTQNFGY